MESLHGLITPHWDHEPTANPSQEGNFRAADECLLPSWEGSGVGRFMESVPCARRQALAVFKKFRSAAQIGID